MPYYDYKCPSCKITIEFKHCAGDRPEFACERCSGNVIMDRVFHFPPVHSREPGFTKQNK